jgi:hypothetical protein
MALLWFKGVGAIFLIARTVPEEKGRTFLSAKYGTRYFEPKYTGIFSSQGCMVAVLPIAVLLRFSLAYLSPNEQQYSENHSGGQRIEQTGATSGENHVSPRQNQKPTQNA